MRSNRKLQSPMSIEEKRELWGGFADREDELLDEVEARWGDTTAYQESARRVATCTRDDWEQINTGNAAIERRIRELVDAGVDMVNFLVLALRIQDRRIPPVYQLRSWSEATGSDRVVRTMREYLAGLAKRRKDPVKAPSHCPVVRGQGGHEPYRHPATSLSRLPVAAPRQGSSPHQRIRIKREHAMDELT